MDTPTLDKPSLDPPGSSDRERFPRAFRILRREEFRAVFAGGYHLRSGPLKAVALPTAGETSRLGLAVGRRVGNAVVRNRLKRRLRELFRRNRDRLAVPVDLVVIPHPGAGQLSFAALRDLVFALFRDAQGVPRKPRVRKPRARRGRAASDAKSTTSASSQPGSK